MIEDELPEGTPDPVVEEAPEPEEVPVSYSKKDVDRISRVAKAGTKSSLLKELGVENIEDAKTILAAAKEREESEKTEQEKIRESMLQAQREAAEAKALAAKTVRDAAVVKSLVKAGASPSHVDDLVRLVVVDEDGDVEDGVEDIKAKFPM